MMSLAAVLSGLSFEFVDGVQGDEILDKVLPPGGAEQRYVSGIKGCWRSHMNVLQR
jgi:hypothetical protein